MFTIYVADSIITNMRQMENASCRYIATVAIVSLMKHHPEEVTERLLSQPLPLDPGTALCWKEIGNNDFLGLRVGLFFMYDYTYHILQIYNITIIFF